MHDEVSYRISYLTRDSLFWLFFVHFLLVVRLVACSSAIDCLEKLVSITHSLT